MPKKNCFHDAMGLQQGLIRRIGFSNTDRMDGFFLQHMDDPKSEGSEYNYAQYCFWNEGPTQASKFDFSYFESLGFLLRRYLLALL